MSEPLKARKILQFWYPLALTWLFMSLEGPLLTALIARLPDATENLAAYGVAFSCGLLLESPVIMLMSASTALVRSRSSYLALLVFTHRLNALVTLLSILFVFPPVFRFVTVGVIGLPEPVSEKMWLASVLLLPWPAAIGIRRFYQGVLIGAGQTRLVARGTVVRLVSMASAGALGYAAGEGVLHGAAIGTLALSTGVLAEAAVAIWFARPVVRQLMSVDDASDRLSRNDIWAYYIPLILTTVIGLVLQPVITFFAGRARFPLESLAVIPVVNSAAFLFRAVGLSFQEVVLALDHGKDQHRVALKRFALWLALCSTVVFCFMAFTPLFGFWFGEVAGLPEKLVGFVKLPFSILFFLPALSVLVSWFRARYMLKRNTVRITLAFLVEFLSVTAVMLIFVWWQVFDGAVAAAAATIVGRAAVCALLQNQVSLLPRKKKDLS